MVYTGTDFSLTGDVGQGDEPFALPPCSIDIKVTEPFTPVPLQSSLQVNMMSDCCWMQAVFSFGIVGSGLMSFGATNWPVSAVLQESNFLVFEPVIANVTPNVPVADFNGVPITFDDFNSGRYVVRMLLLAGEYQAVLMDGTTPVWFANRNVPIPFTGIPKVINDQFVGATGGASLTLTGGHIQTNYQGTRTHDAQGNDIEPYPFRVLKSADPNFTYPNGMVVQYANQTGEGANLTKTWVNLPGSLQFDTLVLNSV